MIHEGKRALLRYYGWCVRRRLRAEGLLRRAVERERVALRQLRQWDRDQAPTVDEALERIERRRAGR